MTITLLTALAIVALGVFCASPPRGDVWTGAAFIVIGAVLGTVVLIAWWDASRASWELNTLGEQKRPDRQLHLRRGAGTTDQINAPDRGQQVRH